MVCAYFLSGRASYRNSSSSNPEKYRDRSPMRVDLAASGKLMPLLGTASLLTRTERNVCEVAIGGSTIRSFAAYAASLDLMSACFGSARDVEECCVSEAG